MYVTLKLDDNGCCRIHSVSGDGNGWIVTNERYVVMPWKMVTRNGMNMTLTEAVDGILSRQESEAKERKRRKREKEEIENKCEEYYEAHMKEETEVKEKVKALTDKPLDKMMESGHIRLAMAKVKCPHKLDISVFCQLTRRLPHEGLDYDDEGLLIHFYDTFYNESIKLLGCTVKCRVNVLYHLLAKIGKDPNADLFQFMKEASHQRTEEEINFVFEHLG